MIKPKRLKCGDTVAIVSLSWGGLGDSTKWIHSWVLNEGETKKIVKKH